MIRATITILLLLSPLIFSNDVRFIVFGDWGARQGDTDQAIQQQQVADAMATVASNMSVDFFVVAGDNFYDEGVKSVDDEAFQRAYKNVYTATSLNKPWNLVLGNHDWRGNPEAEIQYSKRDARWNMPAHYYTFEVTINTEKAFFIMIDSTPIYDETNDYEKQLEWIEMALRKTMDVKWVFLVGHHHILQHKGYSKTMKEHLKHLLNDFNVTVYFSGHKHNLQLSVDGQKTTYALSGAAMKLDLEQHDDGDIIVADDHKWSNLFFAETPGFLYAALNDTVLTLQYFDKKTSVLFEHQLYSLRN